MTTIASYSSVLSFSKCQVAYLFKKEYGYPGNKNLVFGSSFHHGSEIYAENKDRFRAKNEAEEYLRKSSGRDFDSYIELLMMDKSMKLEEAIEVQLKDIKLLRDMLDRLFDLYEALEIEFEATEVKLEHVFPNGANYVGYIDGVVLVDGRRYLMELKTAKSITVSHLSVDLQMAIYMAIFKKEFDLEIDGVIWISTRKATPGLPKEIKGGISVAKNQATTPKLYAEALIERYGSIEDSPQKNQDYLKWLSVHGPEYITMKTVTKNDASLDRYYEMFSALAKDQETLDKTYRGRGLVEALKIAKCTPNSMCVGFCDFSEECSAYLNGGNGEG